MKIGTGILALLAILGAFWAGAESARAATLDDLELGELWLGEAWDKASLKERTVVVEFWGYNCPPCRASLPHLSKLQDEYRDRGLVVLGIHSQNVSREDVVALCRQKEVNFSIYGSGKIKGCSFSGVPKVYLINWKGEVCWDGHPASGLDDAVEEALQGAPDWLVGPRAYEKVDREAGKIRRRRSMGSAAKTLRDKAESDDPLEQEEAKELLGRIEAYAERQMKKAQALVEAGRPLEAQKIWKDLARRFRGDEIGDKASEVERNHGRDAGFKKELAAAKILFRMEAVAGRIDPKRRNEDLAHWQKKNMGLLRQVLGMYKSLERRYGDTKVFARAQALAKSLHLS